MTFVAGTVLTAAALNSELAAKTDLAMTQNAQTGTSYSFALADASKLLTTSNASPVSVTVTKQATVTWVTGTQLRIMNLGAGVTTLVADTGVTINGNVSLKQYQGGTLIRTASDVWLFVPTASSSGVDLITPTSVAGAGVTLTGGEVAFTTAGTVSVNGCFTGAYDNYMIEFNESARSGSISTFMRMRVGGSDSSAANYAFKNLAIGASSNTVTWSAQANGLTATSFQLSNGDSSLNSYLMNVSSPFLAAITKIGFVVGNTAALQVISAAFTAATSFDGLTIYTGSGTITGTLRIYGLRNS